MDDFTTDEVRRDRWGRYKVLHPDGKKPEGYTRATTVAATFDDKENLMKWKGRTAAQGFAQRPDLYAQIDDVKDDRNALNKLVEQAVEAAGGNVKREMGSHFHGILHRAFTDSNYEPPAAYIDDIQAVRDAFRTHGYRVMPEYCERMCVNDKYRIAGTFDLILQAMDLEDDEPEYMVIADFKTGSTDARYNALKFAVQLGIYANADALYVQGEKADGSQDERQPMPAVDPHKGFIVHIEPGSGVCTLHDVSLDPGLISLAMEVRELRRDQKQLMEELPSTKDQALKNVNEVFPGTDEVNEERDMWIRRRITNIANNHKQQLAQAWPDNILPPKKAEHAYTMKQIDDLVEMCFALEADYLLTFPTGDPATPPKRKQ